MKEIDFRYDLLPLKNKIFRFALSLTLNREAAEDFTEDTLVKAWSGREELTAVKSLEAYCIAICKNLCFDYLKSKAVQSESIDSVAHEMADGGISPQEIMEKREKLEKVQLLFRRLPEKQRMVMNMRDVEGKSYKEIASLLNVSEEWVKVNLFRARQTIRKEYIKIENYGL